MTKKKVKQIINTKYFILPVFFAAVLLVGLILIPKNEAKINQNSDTYFTNGIVQEEEKIEETIENGVYTNHTYGFKFNYDEDLFDLNTSWRNDLNGKFTSSPINRNLGLNIRFNKEWKKRADTNYQELYKTTNGEAYMITASELAGDGDTSPTYIVVYPDELGFVMIELGHREGLEQLKLYRSKFNEIVGSFEFID